MTAPPAAGSTMAQTAVFGFSPTLFPVPDDDPPQCRPGAGSSEKPPAHGKTDKVSPVLKSGGRRRPFSLPAADFLLFFLRQRIFQILAERKSFAYFNKTSSSAVISYTEFSAEGSADTEIRFRLRKSGTTHNAAAIFFIGSPPVLFSGNFILYCFIYIVSKICLSVAMNSKRTVKECRKDF